MKLRNISASFGYETRKITLRCYMTRLFDSIITCLLLALPSIQAAEKLCAFSACRCCEIKQKKLTLSLATLLNYVLWLLGLFKSRLGALEL